MIVQLISKYSFYFVLLTSLPFATPDSTYYHASDSASSITPTLTSGNIVPGSERDNRHSLAHGDSPGRRIKPVNPAYQIQKSSANKSKSEHEEIERKKQMNEVNPSKFNITKAPKVKNGNILDDIHSHEVGFGYDEMLKREIDKHRPILRPTERKAVSAEAGKPSDKWTSVEERNVISLEGAPESFESETKEESFEDLSLQEAHSDKETHISTNESSTPIDSEESVIKSQVPHPEQMSDFYELERKTLQDLITAYEDHILESKHNKGNVPGLSSSGSSSGADEIRIPKRKPRNWADWQYMTMNSENMSMLSETINRSAHRVAVNEPQKEIKQPTLQTENMKHCSMEKKMRLCDIHPSFDLSTMKFELCTHIIYEGARILYESKGPKKEDGFRLVVRQRKTQRKVHRNEHTKRDRMLNQLHELKRADQELWMSINLHFTNKPALNALIEEMIANDEKRQIFFNTATNVAEQGGYSGIVVHRAYPGVKNDDSFIHFLRLFKFHLLEHSRTVTPENRKRTPFEKKETKRDIKLAVHMMGTLEGMNFTMEHPYAILAHMEFIIVSPIVKENYWDESSNNASTFINPLVSYANEKAAHNLLDKLMEEKLKNSNFVKGNKTKSYKDEDIEQARKICAKIIVALAFYSFEKNVTLSYRFMCSRNKESSVLRQNNKRRRKRNAHDRSKDVDTREKEMEQKEYEEWRESRRKKPKKVDSDGNILQPEEQGGPKQRGILGDLTKRKIITPKRFTKKDGFKFNNKQPFLFTFNAKGKNVSNDPKNGTLSTIPKKLIALPVQRDDKVESNYGHLNPMSTDKRDPDSMALVKYRGENHNSDNVANNIPEILLAPKSPLIEHGPEAKTMALVKYKGESKQATPNAQRGPSAITQRDTSSIASSKKPQLLLPKVQKLLTFPGYKTPWGQGQPVSNALEAKETIPHSEVDPMHGAKLSTSGVAVNDNVDNTELISEKDVIDSVVDKTKKIFYEFGGVFISPHHDDVYGECQSSYGESFHLSMMILKEEEKYYQKHNPKKF
ncbi:hypothetical protein Ddc_04327 [Ditylenchus destructor]|nr:hypothetical protein Ddc_04327 [Ditylenchus destructor]